MQKIIVTTLSLSIEEVFQTKQSRSLQDAFDHVSLEYCKNVSIWWTLKDSKLKNCLYQEFAIPKTGEFFECRTHGIGEFSIIIIMHFISFHDVYILGYHFEMVIQSFLGYKHIPLKVLTCSYNCGIEFSNYLEKINSAYDAICKLKEERFVFDVFENDVDRRTLRLLSRRRTFSSRRLSNLFGRSRRWYQMISLWLVFI